MPAMPLPLLFMKCKDMGTIFVSYCEVVLFAEVTIVVGDSNFYFCIYQGKIESSSYTGLL